MHNSGAFTLRERGVVFCIIACDKRNAFAHGSESDEAIHTFFVALWIARCARNDADGADWRRGACYRARIRATLSWLA
jgi:hypothetical protein